MTDDGPVVIIPGSIDCNRGDQALVWTAIEFLRTHGASNGPFCLLNEARDPPTDPTSRQTAAKGLPFFRMLLENPNRVLKERGGQVHHGRLDFARVAGRALLDWVGSLWLLLFARFPAIAGLWSSPEHRRTHQLLREARLVVIKGGGFIYAYRQPMYYYYLWFALFHVMFALRLGRMVVILPNSFGPFHTRFSRWLARRVLRRCRLVLTREAKSQAVLEALLPGKAQRYPDMAFLLDVPPDIRDWGRGELERLGVDVSGKAVGITMRPWRFPEHPEPARAYEAYVQAMARCVRHIRNRGYQAVLFVHVQGPGLHEMDRLALEDCQALLGDEKPILVDGPYDCRQMKAMYGHLGAMVGTRFHSCIFALSQGVPTLAISYQGYKAGGIMADMGLHDYYVDIGAVDAQVLVERFDHLMANAEDVAARCRIYMQRIAEDWDRLGEQMRSLLQMRRDTQ